MTFDNYARNFSNMFRFIDEMSSINDGVKHEKVFQHVQLKNSDKEVSLDIKFTRKCFP